MHDGCEVTLGWFAMMQDVDVKWEYTVFGCGRIWFLDSSRRC